jgi:outer membrane protein OmpA-like peptidoglycan-associated protein
MRAAILATIVALGVASSACATRKFVRTQVGEVNSKVETLNKSVEETQERTRQNEVKITQVDAKAEQVGLWAKDAQTSANTAQTSANTAQTSANTAGARADAANAKAEAVDALAKRLLYEVVLSENQGSYKFGSVDLPQEAKARIDQLIDQLKADPRGAYIEIEGHTDNVGEKLVNDRIGLERADAVKRYLYEAHQVPLHKINVISYGEDKPVAPNNTRDGRAQNRRVVIKVLA